MSINEHKRNAMLQKFIPHKLAICTNIIQYLQKKNIYTIRFVDRTNSVKTGYHYCADFGPYLRTSTRGSTENECTPWNGTFCVHMYMAFYCVYPTSITKRAWNGTNTIRHPVYIYTYNTHVNMLANVSFGFRKWRYSHEILSIGKISNTPFYYRRAYYDNTTRRVNVCVCVGI